MITWTSYGDPDEVNKALSEGWKLYGNPFIDKAGEICQAMTRIKSTDKVLNLGRTDGIQINI